MNRKQVTRIMEKYDYKNITINTIDGKSYEHPSIISDTPSDQLICIRLENEIAYIGYNEIVSIIVKEEL